MCSALATTLLRHSVANEAEAFEIFQEELDRFVDPLDREEILLQMGTGYRQINGSVSFSCASCLVASYCGRKH